MAPNTAFISQIDSFSMPLAAALTQRTATGPLTVRFKGGQSLALDLSDARERGLARVLESLHHAGRPAYIEVDDQSGRLRAILFPIASGVQAVKTRAAATDLQIELVESAAIHVLRGSHPKYDEFARLLSDALQTKQTLLVTASAETHEIVDVRATVTLPLSEVRPVREGPVQLTAVPISTATQMFEMVCAQTCSPGDPGESCIPFMFPDDGCWARAHEMCRLMADRGVESNKVWIRAITKPLMVETSNRSSCAIDGWGWHVAPMLKVDVNGATEDWVIDPSLFPEPVPLTVWKYVQQAPDAEISSTERSVFKKFGGKPTDPDYSQTRLDLQWYRSQLHNRFAETGGPPYPICYKPDLYLRDNLDDTGLEPLPRGGISCSPDINHFRDELADPQATLGSAAARARDDLFDRAEYGQPNFIYARLQNRGVVAADANIDIYYSLASSLPTPASWHRIGTIATQTPVAPGEFRVVGPLLWDTVPQVGHYCFIALLDTAKDPKPDLTKVKTIEDFYELIRLRNNVTWKNFDVENFFADTAASYSFVIRGWPGVAYACAIEIDRSMLPADAKVELRVLKRLTLEATVDHLHQVKSTAYHVTYRVQRTGLAALNNVRLRAGDESAATVTITTTPSTAQGAYQFSVRQVIDGNEVGRITQRLNVGRYPYMGNRSSLELHTAACEWAKQIGPRNKVAFENTDRPIFLGYNGCAYCLPELNTDS